MKIKIKSQSNTGGSNNLTVIVFRSNIIFDDNTIINFGGKRVGRGVESWCRDDAAALFSPTSSRARAIILPYIRPIFAKATYKVRLRKHGSNFRTRIRIMQKEFSPEYKNIYFYACYRLVKRVNIERSNYLHHTFSIIPPYRASSSLYSTRKHFDSEWKSARGVQVSFKVDTDDDTTSKRVIWNGRRRHLHVIVGRTRSKTARAVSLLWKIRVA